LPTFPWRGADGGQAPLGRGVDSAVIAARLPPIAGRRSNASYARAKDEGTDALADRLLAPTADVPPELANSHELEMDTGKWYLSKIAHKRYGDGSTCARRYPAPGDPIAVDVLHSLLLRSGILERLSDNQVEALQSAVALVAAATPTVGAAGEVIDAVATPIEDDENRANKP
jgi:hypothetical protein